jgi:hypothetical protein
MAGTADKRGARRLGRRSAWLVALGLFASLSATGALAAVVAGRSSSPATGRPISLRIMPASQTVTAGSAASYSIRVARDNAGSIGLSGRTRLSVTRGGLPADAAISFRPARSPGAALARRSRTTMTITTAADMPPGNYEFRVRARRPHHAGIATVELTVIAASSSGSPIPGPAPGGSSGEAVPPGAPVVAPGAPVVTPGVPVVAPGVPVIAPGAFTIAGTLPNLLTPGTGEPLDLTLTNLESTDLSIASLDVEVTGAGGPRIDPAHTCGSEDFSVEQFSGAPGFILPASSSADLAELGFDASEWPTVSMLDRPVNQDGCQGASIALSFTGTATEATS